MKQSTMICLTLASLVTLGCHRIESHNIPTHALETNVTIVSHDGVSNHVDVNLRLRQEPFTYVNLSSGDTLIAESASDNQTMYPTSFGYGANLMSLGGREEIKIAFHRVGHASALDTKVVMPTPFELMLSSEAGLDSDLLFIEWSQVTSETMNIDIDGPCLMPESFTVDGLQTAGMFIIDSANLLMDEFWSGAECLIDVTVSRTNDGVIDHELWGGRISATQMRTDTFSVYR